MAGENTKPEEKAASKKAKAPAPEAKELPKRNGQYLDDSSVGKGN